MKGATDFMVINAFLNPWWGGGHVNNSPEQKGLIEVFLINMLSVASIRQSVNFSNF